MHGHALSGTRKLNRHWQSGSKKAGLEENLVFFEREIDVEEWKMGECPYILCTSEDVVTRIDSHETYNKRNTPRDIWGLKPLVILNSGDYKVHWNITTRRIESFTRDNESWQRLLETTRNDQYGMFAINMFGLGEDAGVGLPQEPEYIETKSHNISLEYKYYAGHAENYVAYPRGGIFDFSRFYMNDEISDIVTPYRGMSGGTNCFNLVSGQETPEIILHIGSAAPYPQYEVSFDDYDKYAFFIVENRLKSPWISCFFYENVNALGSVSWVCVGKIWLERIGDYTPGQKRWLPEILEVPAGYTILGNRGIIS